MAARTAALAIEITTRAKDAQKGFDQTTSRAERFKSGMSKLMLPAAAVGGALLAMGKKAGDAASDLQQATGAVESVFGKQTKAVIEFSKTSADRMGLSQDAYRNYAALVGSALQNSGFTVRKSVTETDKVMQRAADLSATYGGTTSEAVEAINAAVSRGEYDPLEKYAVSLNATAVNAELAKRGQDKLTGAQLSNAKANIVLEQIYGKTSKAAGQFARESDSAAGAQAIATAKWRDAQATLGTALLPAMSAMAGVLDTVAKFAAKNAGAVKVLVVVLLALSAAVFAVNGALKVYSAANSVLTAVLRVQEAQTIRARVAQLASAAATKISTAAAKAYAIAQRLVNAAMNSMPLLRIITLIALLVGGIILAYKRSETFRRIVHAAFAAVRQIASVVAAVVAKVWSVAFRLISAYVRSYLTAARAVFNAVRTVARTVAGVVSAVWRVAFIAIRAYLTPLVVVFRSAFNVVRGIAQAVSAAVRGDWRGVGTALASVGRALVAPFRAAFDLIRGIASAVARAINSVFGDQLRAVGRAAGAVKNALVAAFNAVSGPVEKLARLVANMLGGALAGVRAVAAGIGDAIAAPFRAAWDVIDGLIDKVKSLGGVVDKVKGVLSHIPGLAIAPSAYPGGVPALQSGRMPGMLGAGMLGAPVSAGRAGSAAGTLAGGGTVVVVNGALDPDAVARQIERILRQRGRRVGSVTR